MDLAEHLLLLVGVDVVGPADDVAGGLQRGDEPGIVVERLGRLYAGHDLDQVHADVDRPGVAALGYVRRLARHHALGPVAGLPGGGGGQVRHQVPGEAGAPVRRGPRDRAFPQVAEGDDGRRWLLAGQRVRSAALDHGAHPGHHVAYAFGAAAQMAVVELVVDEEEPDEPVGDEVQVLGVGRRVDHADERAEVGLLEAGSGRLPVHQAGGPRPGVEVGAGGRYVRVAPLRERAVDVRQFALHRWIWILSGRTRDGVPGTCEQCADYHGGPAGAKLPDPPSPGPGLVITIGRILFG